jgi:hypothetical protein
MVEICRFHNFDVERGCLRRSRSRAVGSSSSSMLVSSSSSCCNMDHEHCYTCGQKGHRAFECSTNYSDSTSSLSSVVFRFKDNASDPEVVYPVLVDSATSMSTASILADGNDNDASSLSSSPSPPSLPLPALLVLGGRLRGRTLAACEMLPLPISSLSTAILPSPATKAATTNVPSSSSPSLKQWSKLPNLREHRGSAAACSPMGSGLAFVLGGGTADGNSDAVEMLDFGFLGGGRQRSRRRQPRRVQDDGGNCCDETNDADLDTDVGGNNDQWRWQELEGRLSEPRHAFGAVACISKIACRTTEANTTTTVTHQTTISASLYAVGGWSHGTVSCGSVELLRFEYHLPPSTDVGGGIISTSATPLPESKWEECAPLLLPRRLHSVVASSDGCYIYVMGGYVDDRRTTSSIECYDVHADKWIEMEESLPYTERGCPLVQAVSDGEDGFLIFPFGCGCGGGGSNSKKDGRALVLKYMPKQVASTFSPIPISTTSDENGHGHLRLPVAGWHSFSATASTTLRKAYLVGGTIDGKWTKRGYELDLQTYEWTELPPMAFARRRLATLVLE